MDLRWLASVLLWLHRLRRRSFWAAAPARSTWREQSGDYMKRWSGWTTTWTLPQSPRSRAWSRMSSYRSRYLLTLQLYLNCCVWLELASACPPEAMLVWGTYVLCLRSLLACLTIGFAGGSAGAGSSVIASISRSKAGHRLMLQGSVLTHVSRTCADASAGRNGELGHGGAAGGGQV